MNADQKSKTSPRINTDNTGLKPRSNLEPKAKSQKPKAKSQKPKAKSQKPKAPR
jgi:hypothetical protein